MATKAVKISDSAKTLVQSFPAAVNNPDLMRGWKRALTLYSRRRSSETGTAEIRYKAAIKMELTKAGYDASGV